jgi:hygromycin-B 7''-O-kinase
MRLTEDGWRPPVQGAVGHVTGVRGPDGTPYVLKRYRDDARRRTEAAALRLAVGPVPRVVDEGPGFLVLTRLPGVRWADRRDGLDPVDTARAAGRLLRRFHAVPGPGYGPLLGPLTGPWERVRARLAEALAGYGGPSPAAVRRYVTDRRDALAACPAPLLCHNDANDGNLLVEGTAITGMVDLERASWDDPLADLAQTRLHVRQHRPDAADAVTAGYGPADGARLDAWELVHLVRERAWVAHDHPPDEATALPALDALISGRTGG